MNFPRLVSSVQPFFAAAAVVVITVLLVTAIYFTGVDVQWIAFLAGILVAASLAVVTQMTRAEATAAQRGQELTIARDQLERLFEQKKGLDAALAEARVRLQLVDESLPALVAFTDAEGVYRYHNDAFRRWLDLPPNRIDGLHMRNVLGKGAYAAIEAELGRVGSGEMVRYERTQKMQNGAVYRMHIEYLPVFRGIGAGGGKYAGFFTLMTDLTDQHDARMAATSPGMAAMAKSAAQGAQALAAAGTAPQPPGQPHAATPPAGAAAPQAVTAVPQSAGPALESYGDSFARQVTGWANARDRIIAAIERNEFTLFCQLITPLAAETGRAQHYEILIRLLEEEDNLIPPGAFFPLAEEHGLLPRLDRWVVSNILQWAAKNAGHADRTFFINVATATMSDPDFGEYVAHELHKSGLAGGAICFEVAQSDYLTNSGDIGEFIRQVKQAGCRVALAGFGRDKVSVDILKSLPLDFLKIDGSVILQIEKDAVGLGKVTAINRVARAIGITTVAEMVESESTKDLLRGIGVDYAQGFGISRPRPLAELATGEGNRKE